MSNLHSDRLPRELGEGVFWLGACETFPFRGELIHSGDSLFLIKGSKATMIVETGMPNDHRIIMDQLDSMLVNAPEVRHIFLTHQETPHAGNVGRLLGRFPNATAHGNVKDYHLIFPEYTERFITMEPNDEIDLGGTSFRAVEPVIRDLNTTLWGFDTRSRTLFAADGFAYAHQHDADQCGQFAEQVTELDIPEMTGLFTDQSLTWARYVDMSVYVRQLDSLIKALDVAAVAPTHGLPARNVHAIMPRIREGLMAAGGVGERFQGQAI